MHTMSRAQFTDLALHVPEFQQAQQSATTVNLIADLLLNMPLDSSTLAHYSGQLDNGVITPVGLVDLALQSDGYQQQFFG